MSGLLSLRRLLAQGAGVTLALTGEAGIGKSYQLTHFLRTLPCRQLLVNADWPLGRLAQVLPAGVGEAPWVSATLQRMVRGDWLPPQDSARALMARLSPHAPLVLSVDQFHKAGPDSQAFWLALGEQVRNSKRLGLVILTRQDAPDHWIAETVLPLSREQSDRLIEENLSQTAPPTLLQWLFAQARGHPGFTLELLSEVQRLGALKGRVHRQFVPPASVPVPVGVTALVRSLLPPELSPELQCALARLVFASGGAALPITPEQAGLFRQWGIMEGQELRHPLYREAIVKLLPQEVVTAQLDELLQQGSAGDALFAAGLLEQWPSELPQARELYRKAARQTEEQGQLVEAGRLWERLAQQFPEERAPALWRASLCFESSLDLLDSSRQLALQALQTRLAQGQELPPEHLERLCRLQGECRAPLDEIRGLIEADPVACETAYSFGLILQHPTGQAARQERLAVWRSLSPEVQRTAPAKVVNAVAVALYREDEEGARALWQEALRRTSDPLERGQIIGKQALIPHFHMDNAGALALYEQGIREIKRGLKQLSSETSLPGRLAYALGESSLQIHQGGRADILFRLGHHAEFETVKREEAQYALSHRSLISYVRSSSTLASGLIQLGRFQEARDLLQDLLATGYHRVTVLRNLVELYFSWSQREEHLLVHFVGELADALRHDDDLQARFVLALGLAECGQFERATTVLSEAEEIAQRMQLAHALWYGEWVRSYSCARQGQLQEAAALAGRATQEARRAGQPELADDYELWLSHYRDDQTSVDRLSQHLSAAGYLSSVQAVQSRRQSLAPPDPSAYLEMLGSTRLYGHAGQRVTSSRVVQLCSDLLCARLLGEDGLPTTVLAEELYPGSGERQAQRNLHRLVRSIQQRLGPTAVVRSGERYVLQNVSSDAELFLNEHADHLWRGPVLSGHPSPWGTRAADFLHEHLAARARAVLPTDPVTASGLAEHLVQAEPYEHSGWHTLLRAYDLAGQPRRSGAAYKRAREIFAEVGEELPEGWQDYLSAQLSPQDDALKLALASGSAAPAIRASSEARLREVHPMTVRRWRSGETQRPGQMGRPAKLSAEQIEQLRTARAGSPVEAGLSGERWTLKLTAEYVQQVFGVQYSEAQLSRLLRKV